VLCDETLAAGVPGVYAAGDLARWHSPMFGRTLRVEHWTTAAEQGSVAGRNAVVPESPVACTAIPYFWSDWYGNRIQCAGVPNGDPAEIVGDPDSGRFVALYRDADLLVGVLAMNHRGAFARYRVQLREHLGGHTDADR
jgi:NADPH-dependent 2,4-dienoyl-CoA reductase/sulfur reductase-like enzyme